jgi:hypothetical protein
MRPVPIRYALGPAAILWLVTFPGLAAGYGLEFTPRDDTVRQVAPNDVAEFHFTLTNTGATSDVYEFNCRVISAVPGWAAVYCVSGVCVEPGVIRYDSIPAAGSDTTPKVTVYTDATEGEEVVSLRVRSMGDTTQAESIGTYTIVGSGVEESRPVAVRRGAFRVAPNPIHRGMQATVSFFAARPTSYAVRLYDAAGISTGIAASGLAPAGEHTVGLRTDQCLSGGIYLVRLTTGGESAPGRLVVE